MSQGNGNPKRKHAPPGKVGPDGLTDKQRAFVEAFVGRAAGNAAKAWEASYGAHEQSNQFGWGLLQQRHIQQALSWYAAQQGLDKENIRRSISDIAQANMVNFIDVDMETGKQKIDWVKAVCNGAMGQIKSYTENRRIDKEGNETVSCKIELHNKQQALECLAKMNGMLVEKVAVQGSIEHQFPEALTDPVMQELATHSVEREIQLKLERRALAGHTRDDGTPAN